MRTLLLVLLLLGIAEGASRLATLQGGEREMVRAWTIHNQLDEGVRKGILPLAGFASRKTLLCQEADGPISYVSDRFGFHNRDETWDKPQIVLLGDSFVQGHCVREEAQLATLLAAGGKKVLNLGLRGSGPFSQLGVLREYALPARPKKILWFVLANDFLFDIQREINVPALTAYSEGGLQGLRARETEIEGQLRQLKADLPLPRSSEGFITVLTTALFRLTGGEPTRAFEEELPYDPSLLPVYAAVLAKGRDVAKAAGVEIEFIFVPDSWVFSRAQGARVKALVKELASLLAKKGIELHDPTAAFEKDGHPLRRFAALEGYYGHYNESGFRLLADFVEDLP